MRADLALVARGLFPSRARARQAIAAGLVRADGEIVRKPAQFLADEASVEARPAHPWASRGGLKLAAGLDAFGLSPAGLDCLDVGASTGGFTDVLLSRGAASVLAVDVGHGQIDARIEADPRVTVREGVDARTLTPADLKAPPGAITLDVSFISQRLVLPAVLALAAPGAWIVSLVKPQFEAGPGALVKGRVRDEAALAAAGLDVQATVEALGWTSLGLVECPVRGGEGAREFLYAARWGGRRSSRL